MGVAPLLCVMNTLKVLNIWLLVVLNLLSHHKNINMTMSFYIYLHWPTNKLPCRQLSCKQDTLYRVKLPPCREFCYNKSPCRKFEFSCITSHPVECSVTKRLPYSLPCSALVTLQITMCEKVQLCHKSPSP